MEEHFTPNSQSGFYVTGGPVGAGSPSYIERDADSELFSSLMEGEFCYVLTSRQMGKTSLVGRMSERLKQKGVSVAVLDPTAFGQNVDVEQWYFGMLSQLGLELGLEEELEEFWDRHIKFGPLQRWRRAIQDIVLVRCAGPIVIFVDEVDFIRSLKFNADEYLSGIRAFYTDRGRYAEFERLTFCLLGVSTPYDLIRDVRTTPFNIGRRIELSDFTEDEVIPLAEGLGRPHDNGRMLLNRALYWTGGQPYLTQRLCQEISEDHSIKTTDDVDRICKELFVSPSARKGDDNLAFVSRPFVRKESLNESDRALLLSDEDRVELLSLYMKVHQSKGVRDVYTTPLVCALKDAYNYVRGRLQVRDDDTQPLIGILRLSGITRTVGDHLCVRNRIYYNVFNSEWAQANMPDAELRRQRTAYRRGLLTAMTAALTIIVLIGSLAIAAVRGRNEAERQRAIASQALFEAESQRREAQHQSEIAIEQRGIAELRLREIEAQRQLADRNAHEAEQQRSLAEQQKLEAVAQREAAEKQRLESDRQREIAVQQKALAERGEEKNNSLSYSASVYLASLAYDASDIARGEKYIDTYLGNNIRGFEWYYLWQLYHRQATEVDEPAEVMDLAGSPANRLLAIARADGKMRLLDSTTLAQLGEFQEEAGSVHHICFSPDGHYLAMGLLDNSIKLWDIKLSKEVYTFTGHTKPINSLAFSPDGRLLASGSDDATVLLWDVGSTRLLASLTGHTNTVKSVTFSPDGSLLISGGTDHTLKLWNTTSFKEVGSLNAHNSTLNAIAFSVDGKILATGSDDDTVKLWDITSRRVLKTLNGHLGGITTIAVSPDNKLLVAGGADNSVKLWYLSSGMELAVLKGHKAAVTSITFSKNSRVLITASHDTTVMFWDIPSIPEVNTIFTEEIQNVNDVPTDNGATANNNYLLKLSNCVTLSPDGKRLATGSRGGVVTVWDAASLKELSSFNNSLSGVTSLAFSPDGRFLAASDREGSINVWDVSTQRVLRTLQAGRAPVNCIAFSSDGKLLAGGGNDFVVHLWDTKTFDEVFSIQGEATSVNSIAFSPIDDMLAIGWGDGLVSLWSISSRKFLATLKAGEYPIFSVSFSSDGKILASGSGDGVVTLWNSNSRLELGTLTHTDGSTINSTAFSPDNKSIATGTGDGEVTLWNVTSLQELLPVGKHDTAILYVAFTPDGKTLVSASDGQTQLRRSPSEEEVGDVTNYAVEELQAKFNDRGIILWRNGKYAEAEIEFRKLVQMDPERAMFHHNLGVVLYAQKKYADAKVEFATAYQLDPNNPDYEAMSQDENLNQLSSEDAPKPDIGLEAVVLDADSHARTGDELMNEKRYASAETEYRLAIQTEPQKALWYVDLGIALFKQNKLIEAEAAFRYSTRLEPDEVQWRTNLGIILSAQKKFISAERVARDAITLNPHKAELYFLLGEYLREQQKLDEAELFYRRAIELDSSNKDFKAALERLRR